MSDTSIIRSEVVIVNRHSRKPPGQAHIISWSHNLAPDDGRVTSGAARNNMSHFAIIPRFGAGLSRIATENQLSLGATNARA